MEVKVRDEDIAHTILTGQGATESEETPEVEMWRSAMKKHCFIRENSFNDLEDEYVLETGSVLAGKGNRVLADLSYNTRSERGLSSSAHGLF